MPGAGEVLVRIRACGLCGSDLNAWRGVPGIEYPMPAGAPGHETWGEVVGLGDHVSHPRVDETVTGLLWNGFAEFGVARAENLVVVPTAFRTAPVLGEPLACAMNVLRRSGLVAGGRFAIVGFGYLAALLVQLLPTGCDWVAISRRQDSRQLALRLGAQAAYGFDNVPSDAWDSFPVVIEAAGVQQALDYATWLVAYGGRLVIAGYHADGPRTVNMQSWNWKGIDVINAHERQPSVYVDALRNAFDQLGERPLDLTVLHTHSFDLDHVNEAFGLAESRPAGFVKALVHP
ncbi:MAG: alcohol dehydrogenase catalytic domain-containing protein [Chloroflexi bacterium]|nr:alcohol dehydrogenase catalytic domain-containing protein [Chloroflexota bacterium]